MIVLRVVQTTPKLILEWDPVPGAVAGYRGRAGGVEKWTQTQGTRMTFAANATGIVIQALGVEDEGRYPQTTPAPLGGKHASTLHYENYQPSVYRYADGDSLIVGEWAAKQAALDHTIPALAYSDLTSAQDSFFTGVPASQVLANGWAAKRNGQPIVNTQWGSVIVDLRIQAYRDAQADAIIARVRDVDHADGVLFDDCMYDPRLICNGVVPDGFTLASWHTASLDAAAYVAGRCRAAGLKVAMNCGWYAPGDPRSDNGQLAQLWAAELAEHADYAMLEYGAQVPPGSLDEGGYSRIRGSGPEWYNNYDGHMEVVRKVEAKGCNYLGLAHTPNGDSAQAVYAKASLLLYADRPGSTCMYVCHDGQAPLTPLLRADLGAAKGPMTAVSGVYRREFDRGFAEVRPGPRSATISVTGGQSATVTLPAAPAGLAAFREGGMPTPDLSAFVRPTV